MRELKSITYEILILVLNHKFVSDPDLLILNVFYVTCSATAGIIIDTMNIKFTFCFIVKSNHN